MSLFKKLFGADDAKPETLQTLEQVGAALDALAVERATAIDARRAIIQRRHEALAADESDAAVRKLDQEIERLALVEDRLDALAPRLHARLAELQTAERRRTLEVLKGEYDAAVRDLDAALAAVLGPLDRFTTLVSQIDAAGFTREAAGFITPPPLMAGGVVASRELLEQWRRERERIADATAAAARPRVEAPTPQPARVIPLKRTIDTGNPRDPAPMTIRRTPRRLTGPIEKGMVRIEAQMNNADFGGMQSVIGDQHDVTVQEANFLLRGVAFKYIAGEEITEDAAQ